MLELLTTFTMWLLKAAAFLGALGFFLLAIALVRAILKGWKESEKNHTNNKTKS